MKNLGVKVSDELHQEMKQYADRNNVSLSELIRMSVEQTLYPKNDEVQPAFDLLQKELDIKNQQIEQANEAQQQANAIIMQLTRQLDQKTLMLEDMRNRSLWRRVKMVFAPSAVGEKI